MDDTKLNGRTMSGRPVAENPAEFVMSKRKISTIMLAGGRSSRMGDANKLLIEMDGRTVVEHAVSSAVEAALGEVIVVTGAEADRIGEVLATYPVRIVHNAEHEEGMASSLRAGVRAVNGEAAGYAVYLADMPFVRSETLAMLGGVLRSHPGSIVMPRIRGRMGHPVLFDARFAVDLLSLHGDVGARAVIHGNAYAVISVETNDPGILQDLDTPQDLASHALPAVPPVASRD